MKKQLKDWWEVSKGNIIGGLVILAVEAVLTAVSSHFLGVSIWTGVIIAMGGIWLGCAYLVFKRDKSRIHVIRRPPQGYKGPWQYPRWRPWAKVGLVIIPLSIVFGVGYQQWVLTVTPTPTPLADRPAASEEIVLLVARFGHNDDEYGIQRRIIDAIEDELDETGIENVRIIKLDQTISPDQQYIVQDVGEAYNATAVIWGWIDKGGFTPNFTITRNPDLFPKFNLEEVGTLPEVAFQTYVREGLPAEMAYFTAWTVAQVYYWDGQFEQASMMLDRAIEEAERRNIRLGLEHIYLYRGVIETEYHHNPRQAISEYNRAIEANPGWSVLYNNRGIAYASLDNYLRAISDYNRAIEVYSPSNNAYAQAATRNVPLQGFAYNNRCMAYLSLNDLDHALDDCNKAIDIEVGTSYVSNPLFNRGFIYWRLKDFDSALADFEAAISHNPQNVEAYVYAGRLHEERDEVVQALLWYERAISVDPGFSQAYVRRGMLYGQQGNDQAALREYEQAILADSNDADAYLERGELYERLGQDENALDDYVQALLIEYSSYESYKVSELCQQVDRCQAVIRYLHDLADELEIQSKDPRPVHIALGYLYDDLEEREKAIRELSIALEMEATSDVYIARASVYLQIADTEAAINDYTAAIALFPENTDAYTYRAQAYENLEELDEALADHLHAVRMNPRASNSYHQIYELCKKTEKCEQILGDLAEEVTVTPFDPNIYLILAHLNQELGDNEEAIRNLSDFLELDPDDLWVRQKRAELFAEVERLDDAIADYTFILNYKPQDTGIYNARANVYNSQRKYHLALEDLSKAAELEPTNEDILSARAALYENLGNVRLGTTDYVTIVSTRRNVNSQSVNELIEYCQKNNTCSQVLDELSAIITEATSSEAQIYYARGRLYEEANQLTDALADYDQAISLVSDNEDLITARARVHEQLGNFVEAVADYSRLVLLDINSFKVREAYTSRAALYEKLGNRTQALEDYVSAVLAYSYSAGPVDDAIRLCKELDTCITIPSRFEEAIERDSKHEAAYIALGKVSSYLGEDDVALAAFNAAIALGDSGEAHTGRAEIYVRKRQYVQATNDYVQALSGEWIYSPLVEVLIETCRAGNTCYEAIDLLNQWINTEASRNEVIESFYFQAQIYEALGDIEQENQAYVNLLSGYATHPWYTDELIRRCNETNSCQMIIELLTRAIASVEENTMLYYTRGRAHSELGDVEASITDFKNVLESSADPDLRKLAEEQLKMLGVE